MVVQFQADVRISEVVLGDGKAGLSQPARNAVGKTGTALTSKHRNDVKTAVDLQREPKRGLKSVFPHKRARKIPLEYNFNCSFQIFCHTVTDFLQHRLQLLPHLLSCLSALLAPHKGTKFIFAYHTIIEVLPM